jgi:uncharacterized Zn finger protein
MARDYNICPKCGNTKYKIINRWNYCDSNDSNPITCECQVCGELYDGKD